MAETTTQRTLFLQGALVLLGIAGTYFLMGTIGAVIALFVGLVLIAVWWMQTVRDESGNEPFCLLDGPLSSEKAPPERKKPNLVLHGQQTPIASCGTDGVWREGGWRTVFLLHFSNDLRDGKTGMPALGVRAQVSWTHENGVSGPRLSPACWMDEPLGAVDIPVGVTKRLLIGARDADNMWMGYANSTTEVGKPPTTRLCNDLPDSGTMHLCLIGNGDEVLYKKDFSWECAFGPHLPKAAEITLGTFTQ